MGGDFIGRAALYLAASALVAAPVAVALIHLFKRAVLRGQQVAERASDGSVEPLVVPRHERVRDARPTLEHADRSLLGSLGVYLIAGIAFAAVFGAFTLAQSPLPPRLLDKVIAFIFACSLHTQPILFAEWVTLPAGGARRAVIAASLALLVAMSLLPLPFAEGATVFDVAFAALTPTLAALLLAAFMTRRIRATGPLVLLVLTGSIVVGNIALDVAFASYGGLGFAGTLVVLASLAVGCVLGLGLMWPVMWSLGRIYRRKLISDQSLTMDIVFGWFAIFFGLQQGAGGLAWMASGIVGFVVYKAVTLAGFAAISLLRRNDPHADILLLRPFALGTRSERLFDQLSKAWLRIGSIHMIAGPDLVMATVSPPEFLQFVSGRIARRFIRNRAELAEHLAALDLEPDPDGRYRINQLYCRDNVWKDAMRALAATSGAVLMDVRGFTVANQGCSFEIAELIRGVPLGRVVFAVDETTDLGLLAHIAEHVQRQMPSDSPNVGMSDVASRIVSVDNSARGRRGLLRALMDASAA